MKPLLLGQRWLPEDSTKVEALMLTEPSYERYPMQSPYLDLQVCIYDPNNAADVIWKHKCTGCAESVLMDAHSILLKWGIEDGSVTDLGTLIAKREADQVIIDQAMLELQSG